MKKIAISLKTFLKNLAIWKIHMGGVVYSLKIRVLSF